MNIIVNALFVRPGINGGTETYCNEICRRWYENSDHSSGTSFTHFCTSRPEWGSADRPGYQFIETGSAQGRVSRIVFEQFRLPRIIKKGSVVFSPGYVGLLSKRHAQVITVHDAYAWTQPEKAGRLRTQYWRLMIPATIRRAKAVIAVSHSTARDLATCLHLSESVIEVVHEAGNHVHRCREDPEVIRSANPDSNGYLLAVGIFKRVKNPERILHSYIEYRERCVASGLRPRDLVLCGRALGSYASALAMHAISIDGIRLLGRVDDASLKSLYMHASGLIFVSLYEGFGLPILEAQELRCPVVTGNCSSMPEVAGKGAIVVPVDDPSAIASAMIQLHDRDIVESLRRDGFENCTGFDWDRSANKTLEILSRAAGVDSQGSLARSGRP